MMTVGSTLPSWLNAGHGHLRRPHRVDDSPQRSRDEVKAGAPLSLFQNGLWPYGPMARGQVGLCPEAGTVLDVGRRSRRATAAIRRAVRERDGARCAFWGCESRRTDLHHIQWWSHGGQTSAKNLLPVCTFHHALIHRDRLVITRTRHGYTFTSPATGRTVGPPGQLPEPAADISTTHNAFILPETIDQATGERLDLHYAIWVALSRSHPQEPREVDLAQQQLDRRWLQPY